MDATTSPSDPSPSAPRPGRSTLASVGRDVVASLVWFAVAGVLGGLVWVYVVTPPKVTRTAGTATVSAEELMKQVGIDGWFAVTAATVGLLSGVALLAWRRRDPLLMVALVALGGGLASWTMLRVGALLGPDEEIGALRRLPDGSHVSERLILHAPGVAWVWPIAACFGALVYLWVVAKPIIEAHRSETA